MGSDEKPSCKHWRGGVLHFYKDGDLPIKRFVLFVLTQTVSVTTYVDVNCLK